MEVGVRLLESHLKEITKELSSLKDRVQALEQSGAFRGNAGKNQGHKQRSKNPVSPADAKLAHLLKKPK